MATLTTRKDYANTEEGIAIRAELQLMAADGSYNTVSSYASNTEQYPDNRISFVKKHMNYLTAHPNLDARMYVANLRLMTRIR
jgi:hypothetical protein